MDASGERVYWKANWQTDLKQCKNSVRKTGKGQTRQRQNMVRKTENIVKTREAINKCLVTSDIGTRRILRSLCVQRVLISVSCDCMLIKNRCMAISSNNLEHSTVHKLHSANMHGYGRPSPPKKKTKLFGQPWGRGPGAKRGPLKALLWLEKDVALEHGGTWTEVEVWVPIRLGMGAWKQVEAWAQIWLGMGMWIQMEVWIHSRAWVSSRTWSLAWIWTRIQTQAWTQIWK